MARYKHIDTSPKFVPVDLTRQLLPGTFEHALNHLLDHEVDLSGFDARYCNDETGASAYPPAMLLKVIRFAYAQGIVRSRDIERACRSHVTFIALCGDRAPHFTTLAGFIATLGDEVAHLFGRVLFICDRQGVNRARDVRDRWGEAARQRFQENLRYNKGLDRFTLRGKTKVDAQWKLFCLVHNIEKLAHHGYAQSRSEEAPPTAALSARLRHEPSNDSLRCATCDHANAITHARERRKKGFFYNLNVRAQPRA